MEHDVRLEDGGAMYEVPESHYRARGYQPPIDQLPWCPGSEPRGPG